MGFMINILNNWIGKTARDRVENLYLLLLAVYILFLSIYASNYQFPLADEFMILLYALTAVTVARLVLLRPWNRKLVLAFLAAAVYILAYRVVKSYFLLFLAVLSIGTIDIDYKKIVKLYTVVIALFCFLWVTASFIGLFPNIVYYRAGNLRSSWGMAYPTDFASLLLFLLMFSWLAWDRISNLCLLVLGVFLFFFSWYITVSRTSMICSVLICVIAFYHMAEEHVVNRRLRTSVFFDFVRKLMVFFFPLGILLTVLSVVAYMRGNGFAIQLNELLTRRLELTEIIYRDQGIHPFGKLFSMAGNGGTSLPPLGLYFLDSSYSNILICHGWVTLTLICLLWVRMSWIAYQRKDFRLLSVMALIAFHALTEHHFKDVNYNVLLAIPLAAIPAHDEKRPGKIDLKELLNNRKPMFITALVEVAGFVLLLPLILSRLRTLLALHGEVVRWSERFVVLGLLYLLTCVFITLSVQICKVSDAVRKKLSIKNSTLLIGALSAIILCVIIVLDSVQIHIAEKKLSEQIEVEDTVIETILSAASGKVVVEDLPEVYHLRYGKLYRPFFWGDDLARLSPISVVTDRAVDRQRFVDRGFYYTPISEQHSLYSNDSSVIEALSTNGYEWTNYYSERKTIDLTALAEDNELSLTKDGYLLLTNGQCLANGPWVDLQKGRYSVRFRFQIKSADHSENDELCTINITDFYHARGLASKTITVDALNGKSTLTKSIKFSTSGSRAAEFCVYPKVDQLIITEITYQKIGK